MPSDLTSNNVWPPSRVRGLRGEPMKAQEPICRPKLLLAAHLVGPNDDSKRPPILSRHGRAS
jgi:hypothetical protein